MLLLLLPISILLVNVELPLSCEILVIECFLEKPLRNLVGVRQFSILEVKISLIRRVYHTSKLVVLLLLLHHEGGVDEIVLVVDLYDEEQGNNDNKADLNLDENIGCVHKSCHFSVDHNLLYNREQGCDGVEIFLLSPRCHYLLAA